MAPASGARTPLLLLILADAARRSRMRQHLGDQGFLVHGFGDAAAALAWLERRQAAIVIADVLLPGTRIAVPHVLRRRHRSPCPLIIGLAPAAADCAALRSALGFDDVVAHDVPVAVLTRHILDLLSPRPTGGSGPTG